MFIYSCSARRISFESDCFYGMWTWTWISEYTPPPLPPIIASRYGPSGVASPTIWSCYGNISVLIKRENNQFLKKWIMIWNLHSMTKLSGWPRHCTALLTILILEHDQSHSADQNSVFPRFISDKLFHIEQNNNYSGLK